MFVASWLVMDKDPGASERRVKTSSPPVRTVRVVAAQGEWVRAVSNVCCVSNPERPLLGLTALTTTCVTPEMPLARVEALFAELGLRAAPVVDASGRLVGLVSRSDLRWGRRDGLVVDVMTSPVHALPFDAPADYAIALMAADDISEIPLVEPDGTVVAMCRALDVVRDLARELGIVMMPKPARVA